MNKYAVLAVASLAMPAVAAQAAPDVNTNPAAVPSGHYTSVPGHTEVTFGIIHMGMSPFYGMLGNGIGTLDFSSKDPAKSTVSVKFEMNGIYTPSERLNGMLRDADVFDVAQFPEATFTSTSIRKTARNKGDITGNLTLHGVTKPVTLHATFYGSRQMMGERMGFGATARIKRSDFGLTEMKWDKLVADGVDLMIEAEFVQDNGQQPSQDAK